MSMILSVIAKEEIRNEKMILEYTKELSLLPKGCIKAKTIKGNVYYYLCYREGKKVINKYIGKEKDTLDIQEKLLRRNQIEGIIKKLKEEQAQIKKLEALL